MNKEELIKNLNDEIECCEKEKSMDFASYVWEAGVLLTGNEAKLFLQLLENDVKGVEDE